MVVVVVMVVVVGGWGGEWEMVLAYYTGVFLFGNNPSLQDNN